MNGDESSPAVTASGVFVSYGCEQAYDFDPEVGTLVWHHDTSCEGGGGRTAVYHSGRLYIRDDAGKQPVSLDAQTGEVAGTFSATAAPAFDGATAFFLSNGTLLGVNLTDNRIMWTYGGGSLTSAPIVAHGLVYAGAGDGKLVALAEKTGTPVWSGSAGAPILAPDEHNVAILPGNGVAEGRLFVAASTRLTVFVGRP